MSRRVGLRYMSAIAGKIKKLFAPLWGYDNPVGNIFCMELGGYDKSPTGQVEVREPAGLGGAGDTQGGHYDNR